ncbi:MULTISPECIES: ABC transporter permease [Paenarthrobacter]|uniref:ABC-2 type transport system permease protein n=1 Tax=Paenarthrobacter nicotinovorans TaxID=29320 RepID=A0ABT9TKV7_PAENI|nr:MULTISPECIES: ABC transporter permease [Paenarthrobacter]SKB63531.1 ABC-2 type transport system permease protein [Arthrobacter sp. 31Cvi3.1E]BCW10748.1 ABC transporter [Arthrobacter sp. NtRootA2]BCW14832.1 ABC transporter [Arthrobacter sp. NtRootA4]BCW23167.1 ABC transporter [Arthrobacter sp. NtRootC7]BCW27434.1 ABC transporter [Arthrobacter sp. NtRootC45]BCW31701.1 ABC transporter [Arthrobacter sp. NtRootD5]BCW40589.1 ABC transporter [Arthrobacter sp. StoSoilB3]
MTGLLAPNAGPASLPRRIMQQGRYETITMLRNGEQLILAIVLPLMALVGLVVTPLLDGLGPSRVDTATPGILALCAMSTAFTGQGIATGFDRRYGVLRFLSTTPLGRGGLIAGKILAVLVVLALQVLVVGAVAGFLGWQPRPEAWLPGLGLLVLGAAAFTALGLLVAGTVRPEATLAITNLLWILLGALGGIVVPADRLPAVLQGIVHFLPSGALGQGLRDAFLQGTIPLSAVVILLLWTVLAGGAAIRWFKWN